MSEDLRAELVAAVLESVRVHGRAPTAQVGAERAADALLPIIQREIDAEWEGITVRGMPKTRTSHAEWCHTVIGCVEPDHCTCNRQWSTTTHPQPARSSLETE